MASITYRGNARVLSWRENGKLIHLTIGRRGLMSDREANLILKAKELELASGTSILLDKSSSISFEAFARKYKYWHEQEFPDSHFRIKQIIEDHLLPFFKGRRLDTILESDTSRYKTERGALVKSTTVGKEIRTLKAMFAKALEWGLVRDNKIKHVKEPQNLDSKPAMFYTAVQLQLLYAAEPFYAPIWALFANTGMRRSEGLHLKWSEVHPTFARILSTEDERTKSKKWRDVPLNKSAHTALMFLQSRAVDEYVLPRMAEESLSRAAIRCGKSAAVGGSLHVLRHTFCSHLVMRGAPLRAVQVLAGHSSVTVTEGYAHLAPDHMQDILKGFEL